MSLDTTITAMITLFWGLITLVTLTAARDGSWRHLPGIGSASLAVTYAMWVGLVPAWAPAAPYVGLSEPIELLLLVGIVCLAFVAGFVYGARSGAVVGFCVGLLVAVGLLAGPKTTSPGWLVAYPPPVWFLFWFALVGVPMTFFFANSKHSRCLVGGLLVYTAVLGLLLLSLIHI